MSDNGPTRAPAAGWRVPVVAAVAVLAAFWSAGGLFFDGFQLDLGSILWPTPAYSRFLSLWSALGALSAGLLALGLSRWTRSAAASRLRDVERSISDPAFLALAIAAAVALPLFLRGAILHGARLTDDEAAYRFLAELLASGRLRA